MFKQRKAFPSDLYSDLFEAGRGSEWGLANPGLQELGPGPSSVGPHASQGGSWCSPWFLGRGAEQGRVSPSRGMGRQACQPSQQALFGWRAQLWIWFSQNTKPPAWSLSPRHWGLCQACAHPLYPCQGGGWAGHMDTVAPAGLSGRRPVLLPKASPASLAGAELLRPRGDLTPWKSICVGQEPPHHGSSGHVFLIQCSRFVSGLSKLSLIGVPNRESLLS